MERCQYERRIIDFPTSEIADGFPMNRARPDAGEEQRVQPSIVEAFAQKAAGPASLLALNRAPVNYPRLQRHNRNPASLGSDHTAIVSGLVRRDELLQRCKETALSERRSADVANELVVVMKHM